MQTRVLGSTGLTAGAAGLGCTGMTHAGTTGDQDGREAIPVPRSGDELAGHDALLVPVGGRY